MAYCIPDLHVSPIVSRADKYHDHCSSRDIRFVDMPLLHIQENKYISPFYDHIILDSNILPMDANHWHSPHSQPRRNPWDMYVTSNLDLSILVLLSNQYNICNCNSFHKCHASNNHCHIVHLDDVVYDCLVPPFPMIVLHGVFACFII